MFIFRPIILDALIRKTMNSIFFRYSLQQGGGGFVADVEKPPGWSHVLLNYNGPGNGQGIQVYNNGVTSEGHGNQFVDSSFAPSGSGQTVIGRYFSDREERYTSLEIDELAYFNMNLNTDQIGQLDGMYD